MTQPLSRLEAVLGRLRRQAEAQHLRAVDLAARHDAALAAAAWDADQPALRLQLWESLHLVLVREASQHAQRVAASRQALQEAAREHKKIERLIERRRREAAGKQARREQRTIETWLRSRRP